MSNRREFIKQAGFMSTALMFNPSLLTKYNYKLGLQLYTIHKQISADVRGTLKKAASFGYREVETYGFNYGNNKYYWGNEPKEMKKILDEFNLTSSAGHYDLDKFMLPGKTDQDLERYVDECIKGALTLKQDYIVWPWLDPRSRTIERFKVLAAKLNKIGEQIKKAGLQLAYHNHDFEFIDYNGQIGYDIILKETDKDLVKMEMDLFWFSHSAKLPASHYFDLYPGRFVLWHIKDMDKQNRDLHTVVGDGSIDFAQFFRDAKKAGLKHVFVEQGNNYVPDAMFCIEKSARYMKENFLK